MRTNAMKFIIPIIFIINSVFSASNLKTQDVCHTGRSQSPVDFRSVPVNIQQSGFKILYDKIQSQMIWNRKLKTFTMQIPNNQRAQYKVELHPIDQKTDHLTNDKKEFNLHSVHFRITSEHLDNGKSYPLEIQFIHYITSADPNYSYNRLAYSLFAEPTDQDPDHLLEHVLPDSVFEMTGFISALNGTPYFHYLGSLTFPPCSEDVNWFVFTKSLKISRGIYDAMIEIISRNTNNRTNNSPVKSLAQRKVYKFGK
jgi:carbonic anhydrase